MSFINPQSKEINCKIVYYGPPFSGKSTNLKKLYEQADPSGKSRLLSLPQEEDRTLFFDFLPLLLGKVKGYALRLHLYTVPGQTQLEATRKLLLKGVDGVIFVADSQMDKLEVNLQSWRNLEENLQDHGFDFKSIPMVVQMNKRDLKEVLPVSDIRQVLNNRDYPHVEAVAIRGEGVMESLKIVAKEALKNLRQR